jgi:hypothetical protein
MGRYLVCLATLSALTFANLGSVNAALDANVGDVVRLYSHLFQHPSASSNPDSANYSDVDYSYGRNGGPQEVVVEVQGSVPFLFKTFCLERDEGFTSSSAGGPAYTVYNVSNTAHEGGDNVLPGDGDLNLEPGELDPISVGTAWLYGNYRISKLDEFDLGPDDFQYSDNNWAQALQTAIWSLEGEVLPVNLGVTVNGYVAALLAGVALYAGPNHLDDYANSDIYVINVHGPNNELAQSFLGFDDPERVETPVPEPSTVAVWAVGLLAISLVRKRRLP